MLDLVLRQVCGVFLALIMLFTIMAFVIIVGELCGWMGSSEEDVRRKQRELDEAHTFKKLNVIERKRK